MYFYTIISMYANKSWFVEENNEKTTYFSSAYSNGV